MHYTFFSTKGQEIITTWVTSREGRQFWREQLVSCATKAGSSAILELAVIVVLYLLYAPFQGPTEELIPFLNELNEERKQRLLESLGNAILVRISFDHGKDCLQLVNLLFAQLPKSFDQVSTEDACVLLLHDIGWRGRQSREAFLSNRTSLCNMVMPSTEIQRSTQRRHSTSEICADVLFL